MIRIEDFACPYCGAGKGERCRTATGNRLSLSHQARFELVGPWTLRERLATYLAQYADPESSGSDDFAADWVIDMVADALASPSVGGWDAARWLRALKPEEVTQ